MICFRKLLRDLLVIAVLCLAQGWFPAFAQDGNDPKKIKQATAYFDKAEFARALEVFKKIDNEVIKGDALLSYRMGICLYNSDLEKQRAIPYLESAWEKKDPRVPIEVLLYLGELYHFQHRFKKAMELYVQFENLPQLKNFPDLKVRVAKQKATTEFASEAIWDSVNVDVRNFGKVVNSPWAEHSPIISADENILIFTATERQSVQDINTKMDLDARIYISYKKDKQWSVPELVRFPGYDNGNFGSVALYADGQRLMVYKGSKGSGNIFECQALADSTWSAPEKVTYLSSRFWEGSASLSPDGNSVYFSSTRPGGYGGKDIYKVERIGNDSWSKPINLGPLINTPYDEDAPFIHPDQKTLYFSSNGHTGMGGYDIFKTRNFNGEWTVPVNLGYPINSTGDDIYFVLSADGINGYMASNRRDGIGDLDLYSLVMPAGSIPLTMVRGRITAGDPARPVKTKIKVMDKETNKKVRYVYNPNSKTGKYLMIFPPGKNYDMIVEAEGYAPHLINIYIPHQNYFYELYQEIHLDNILSGESKALQDTVVGEQLSIRNTFYDVRNHLPDTSKPVYTNFQKEYEPLLSLIEKLIVETDSSGLENLDREVGAMVDDSTSIVNEQDLRYSPLLAIIDQIIETTDSIALQNIDEITSDEVIENRYMLGQPLQPYYFGEDTIYTTPLFKTYHDGTEIHADGDNKPDIDNNLKKITIHFASGDVTISKNYQGKLSALVDLLIKHPDFSIRIDGYTDRVGAEEDNLILSRKRSETIKKHLVSLGIPDKRIAIYWHGESGNEKKQERKAVISLLTE